MLDGGFQVGNHNGKFDNITQHGIPPRFLIEMIVNVFQRGVNFVEQEVGAIK